MGGKPIKSLEKAWLKTVNGTENSSICLNCLFLSLENPSEKRICVPFLPTESDSGKVS
jgi:hypothetical protein